MSTGYKIEIVLISIAILLVGSIFVVSKLDSPKEQPKIIQTVAYKQTTKVELKININTANKQELSQLEGIGEKTAQKIIEYRKKNPFKKIEDIQNVSGIGEKTFDAIKRNITVE